MRFRRGALVLLLQRTFDLTEEQALAMANRLVPVFDGNSVAPEDLFIIGQKLAWGGISIGAGAAGTRTVVGLRNISAAARPSLLIVEETVLSAVAATSGVFGRIGTGTLITGTTVCVFRDLQWAGAALAAGSSAAELRSDNTQALAAYGGAQFTSGLCLAAAAPLVLREPYVIPSLACVFWGPGADAAQFAAHFAFREIELAVGGA